MEIVILQYKEKKKNSTLYCREKKIGVIIQELTWRLFWNKLYKRITNTHKNITHRSCVCIYLKKKKINKKIKRGKKDEASRWRLFI